MEATLIRVGNSANIRLAKPILAQSKLRIGDKVELTVIRGGKIVITPQKRKYTLREMLKGMKPKNWQPLINWGEPVGKEKW